MSLSLTLKIWRQLRADAPGEWKTYPLRDVSRSWSFLELLDHLNHLLVVKGERAIEFDHDCREGICGACGILIDGRPHGPLPATTVCQLHLREFENGATLVVEPFRAKAFPVVCDLKVDRSALDRILQAGAYVSTNIGAAPEANAIAVSRDESQAAFAAAACIGCGACVAACKNASAALFTGAKASHLSQLPQGRVEGSRRVRSLVQAMDTEGFGHCSNTEACTDVCPQSISSLEIGRLNALYQRAQIQSWLNRDP